MYWWSASSFCIVCSLSADNVNPVMYQENLAPHVVFMTVDIKFTGIANDLWSKTVYHRFTHCILYTSMLVAVRLKFHHTYLTRHGRCTRWHHLRVQCMPFIHFTVTYIVHLHTFYRYIHCTFVQPACGSFTKLSTLRGQHILNHTTWTTNIFSVFIYLRGGGAGLSRFTHTTLSVTCQAWQPGGQPYCIFSIFSGSIQSPPESLVNNTS